MTRQHRIETQHGTMAVEEAGAGTQPVVLIHGNSSCRAIFRHQTEGRIAVPYRRSSFSRPGHGQSSDAPDPARSYTMPGYADAAVETLRALDVDDAVVFGWSLGGHIGIEMGSR